MNIKDYEFHIGDEVITTDGVKGEITYICDCECCEERGFYEPFWRSEDGKWENYISVHDAKYGFSMFYRIGKYRFNDFDKSEVLREIADFEDDLKQLRKQLRVIEELERMEENNA